MVCQDLHFEHWGKKFLELTEHCLTVIGPNLIIFMYVCMYVLHIWINSNYILCITIYLIHSVAFTQPATGPSSVCEGSNVTLQCKVVFNDESRDSEWFRNGTSIQVGANDFIPNHSQVLNSTTGAFTDLVITNVTMEDDTTMYTCSSNGNGITSSVVLNVSGEYVHLNDYLFVVKRFGKWQKTMVWENLL